MSVTRKVIIDTLIKWSEGEVDHNVVFDWANSLYLNEGVTLEDWEGDDSVSNEVLAYLDTLDMNLVVKDDIPALLEFLGTRSGGFKEGYIKWQSYKDSIDFNERKSRLGREPLYRPFCGDANIT